MSIFNINGKFSTQPFFNSANLDFSSLSFEAQKHRNTIEWIQIQSKQQIRNMQDNDIILLKQMICTFLFQFSTFLRLRYRFIILFLWSHWNTIKSLRQLLSTNFFLKNIKIHSTKKCEINFGFAHG